jgi:hypothetical protein
MDGAARLHRGPFPTPDSLSLERVRAEERGEPPKWEMEGQAPGTVLGIWSTDRFSSPKCSRFA